MRNILKEFLQSKKGVAIVWMQVLLGIFVIGFAYLIFSWILYGNSGIETIVINGLQNSTANTTRALQAIGFIDIIWQVWPFILIFGLILWGVVASQRRDPNDYYSPY